MRTDFGGDFCRMDKRHFLDGEGMLALKGKAILLQGLERS